MLRRMRGAARVLPLFAALVLAGAGAARAAVEISAEVSRRAFAVGETSTLDVTVRGATAGIQEPDLGVPPGIELLGSGRTQSFSWINGRSSSATVFRFEIGATEAGRFTLGPIRVKVGTQTYESPAVEITVSAAATRIGASGAGEARTAASLLVDVTPETPYVGQPVVLRVRLVQRTALAEEPQYTPPPTPGFWAERFRDPESYYADEGNRRVLVTETRARLYPIAAGRQTIGEATAVLALPTGLPAPDPMRWLGGGMSRREVRVRSTPREVRVRALPAGAPAGYGGAVGQLELSWSADRARTAEDVPFTVRLEVRGAGNLPLIETPALEAPDTEVFPATVDDSLGAAGEAGTGRRRFEWTVLARRIGTLQVEAPAFAWFDPARGSYRNASLAPIEIEVGPPLFTGAEDAEAFPAALAGGELDPGARGAEPWAGALAGLLLGAAIVALRVGSRPLADAADRAAQREWLRSVGLARGRDFWQAADGAAAWLAARGAPVAALRRDIDAARYGAGAAEADAGRLRPRIVEQLGRALPVPAPRWPLRAAALMLVLSAIAVAVWFGPRGGDDGARTEARRADLLARGGELDGARAAWRALWSRGFRAPGLAARLGWAAIRSGEVGDAAAWALRGEREESRDGALVWVRERVREGGGLVGAGGGRLPVRRLEWAVLALALGIAAGAAWPRRGIALALAALCVAAGSARLLESRWIERAPRAVVLAAAPLEGSDLTLEPGQVVTVLSRAADSVRVRAARDLVGRVPETAIETVGDVR